MTEKKLNGLNVVFFESRHSRTLGDLIALQGGCPFAAPAMKEIPLENNTEAFGFAEKLFANEIDLLILLTGVGTRTLMATLETRYSREQILSALKKTMIVPRGPKPIRVLNEWGVPFAVTVPEPNTWRELLKALDGHLSRAGVSLSLKIVAVQEYGVSNPELLEGLEARGANVLRVPVYRWALPDDVGPLKSAILKIIAGEAQVAMFTTAVQADHLFEVARQTRQADALKNALNQTVIASIGPDCSEALRRHGLHVDIEPENSKMAALVLATAEKTHLSLRAKRSNLTGEIASSPASPRNDVKSTAPRNDVTVSSSASGHALEQSVFLKACRREKTPYTPVWLMRQAGRYMKDYRAIREKMSFLELCKDPAIAAEVTVTAQEKLNTDVAIIFSDILLLLEPMGFHVNYLKHGGPSIVPALGDVDVDRLPPVDVQASLSFVYEAIRQSRSRLKATVPLIGFVGAPFTLAAYIVEGGPSKHYTATKKFMLRDRSRWNVLMNKLLEAGVSHLNAQIDAGVQAVQVFDSWAGVLTPEEYEKFVMPYTRRLIQGVRTKVPVIHFAARAGHFLDKISQAGGNVIGVDHRLKLDEAWKKIGEDKAIQGNLDPLILCTDEDQIRDHVRRVLTEAGRRPGHIFNLGHGVLPETPESHAIALVEMVHELSQQ